jgi:hypothetical protein
MIVECVHADSRGDNRLCGGSEFRLQGGGAFILNGWLERPGRSTQVHAPECFNAMFERDAGPCDAGVITDVQNQIPAPAIEAQRKTSGGNTDRHAFNDEYTRDFRLALIRFEISSCFDQS